MMPSRTFLRSLLLLPLFLGSVAHGGGVLPPRLRFCEDRLVEAREQAALNSV